MGRLRESLADVANPSSVTSQGISDHHDSLEVRAGRADLPCTCANVCDIELRIVGGDRRMDYISGCPRPEGVHQVEPGGISKCETATVSDGNRRNGPGIIEDITSENVVIFFGGHYRGRLVGSWHKVTLPIGETGRQRGLKGLEAEQHQL